LRDGVVLYNERELSLLEKQGIIKSFEFTHEFAWKVIKYYFEYQGNFSLRGSGDSVREGFKYELMDDGNLWMIMIETRNITSHSYDKEIVEEVINNVISLYMPEFIKFEQTMLNIKDENEN
jgi:nucleotidyltransferase substrate binding protein (TIGR01987 family)